MSFFSRFAKAAALASTLVSILYSIGCMPPANTNQLNSNAPSNPPSPAAVTQPSPLVSEQAAVNTPFTLPLLDAMLVDETFVSEAKSALQLTDLEIQRLRDVARKAVSGLSNDPAVDESRSTKASADEARKQVEEVLGAERTGRFIALVQQKWSGGEDLPVPNPGTVPADSRIVVNAPAYRMDVFDKGKLVKSYKIGIGYPEFPLPTGLRKAKAIIFNPTWTPPDEPWVKGKISPGKKVEAGSSLNPLGPIKIPIGLPSLIHGGKSPAKLGTFASHGCVGLTNAQVQDFAMRISSLSGKPLSLQDIKAYEKTKTETKEVKLEEDIPVELRYETIVVENGTLKIFRDVYERGTNTEENLKRVLDSYGVSLDQLASEVRDKILAGLTQMAANAAGKPIANAAGSNSNQNSSSANTGARSKEPASDKVTRNVKGKKEISFKLPELAGKGYPVPVGAS
ncbi:MAG TPA: L,D-transpeptidase [Pyrinomonadaceae bacterium]|nr:L,D-transpeptidase [Pyrinomonadaceae bacterium]